MRHFGNLRGSFLDASDQPRRSRWIVMGDVSENLVEIGKRAAFVAELHALR
jgi:hypothetical protein